MNHLIDAVNPATFLLHVWGVERKKTAQQIPMTVRRHEEDDGTYLWFPTKEEREVAMKSLRAAGLISMRTADGALSLYRTVAVMRLVYQGKEYPYAYDFGYGYPPHSAYFMFKEGNYACDCNRSMLLESAYPELNIPDRDDCGTRIESEGFHVELRKEDGTVVADFSECPTEDQGREVAERLASA